MNNKTIKANQVIFPNAILQMTPGVSSQMQFRSMLTQSTDPLYFDTISRTSNLTGFASITINDQTQPAITFIQTSTGKQLSIYYDGTNFNISGSLVADNLTTSVYSNINTTLANILLQLAGTNSSGLLTLINGLVSQMASTDSAQVASGLNTRINNVIASIPNISTLVSQMASTDSAQVSSGLNTRINNVIASIPSLASVLADIATLQNQMSSAVGFTYTSGLQTQLNTIYTYFNLTASTTMSLWIQGIYDDMIVAKLQLASSQASPYTSGLQTQISSLQSSRTTDEVNILALQNQLAFPTTYGSQIQNEIVAAQQQLNSTFVSQVASGLQTQLNTLFSSSGSSSSAIATLISQMGSAVGSIVSSGLQTQITNNLSAQGTINTNQTATNLAVNTVIVNTSNAGLLAAIALVGAGATLVSNAQLSYLVTNYTSTLLTSINANTTFRGSMTNAQVQYLVTNFTSTLLTSINASTTFRGSLTNADLTGVIADMNSIETILNVASKALNFTSATWTIYNPQNARISYTGGYKFLSDLCTQVDTLITYQGAHTVAEINYLVTNFTSTLLTTIGNHTTFQGSMTNAQVQYLVTNFTSTLLTSINADATFRGSMTNAQVQYLVTNFTSTLLTSINADATFRGSMTNAQVQYLVTTWSAAQKTAYDADGTNIIALQAIVNTTSHVIAFPVQWTMTATSSNNLIITYAGGLTSTLYSAFSEIDALQAQLNTITNADLTYLKSTWTSALKTTYDGYATTLGSHTTSINTLVSQLASSSGSQVSSGLQTQINAITSGGNVGTLTSQMASSVGAPVSSGLQTQITTNLTAYNSTVSQVVTLMNQMASTQGAPVSSGLNTQIVNNLSGQATINSAQGTTNSTVAGQITALQGINSSYGGQTGVSLTAVVYPSNSGIANGNNTTWYPLCNLNSSTPITATLPAAGTYMVNWSINFSVTSTSGNYYVMRLYNSTAGTDYQQGECWSGVTSGNNNYVGNLHGCALCVVSGSNSVYVRVRLGNTNNAPTGLIWGNWDVNWFRVN